MAELTTESIETVLRTDRLGRAILTFDRVGSTNDVAHQEARAGAPDGLLVLAEEQTAGRGRLGRSWWAPPGTCLLMSLLVAPARLGGAFPLRRAGQLTMCLGIGAVEAIAEVAGVSAQLKWPNDVLVGGRKLGGMLTELSADGDLLNYAVLGLGLNVNLGFASAGAPQDLVLAATSLELEAGHRVDRLVLLASILLQTEHWYDRVLDGNSVHEAWAARLETLGRRVRISLPAGSLEGIAVGVSPEGGLLVQEDSGAVQTVWSGDVSSLR